MAQGNNSVAAKKPGRVGNFFRGVLSELKKVHWPSKKQVANYTVIVLVFTAVMALAIWIVDSIFSLVITKILGL